MEVCTDRGGRVQPRPLAGAAPSNHKPLHTATPPCGQPQTPTHRTQPRHPTTTPPTSTPRPSTRAPTHPTPTPPSGRVRAVLLRAALDDAAVQGRVPAEGARRGASYSWFQKSVRLIVFVFYNSTTPFAPRSPGTSRDTFPVRLLSHRPIAPTPHTSHSQVLAARLDRANARTEAQAFAVAAGADADRYSGADAMRRSI